MKTLWSTQYTRVLDNILNSKSINSLIHCNMKQTKNIIGFAQCRFAISCNKTSSDRDNTCGFGVFLSGSKSKIIYTAHGGPNFDGDGLWHNHTHTCLPCFRPAGVCSKQSVRFGSVPHSRAPSSHGPHDRRCFQCGSTLSNVKTFTDLSNLRGSGRYRNI